MRAILYLAVVILGTVLTPITLVRSAVRRRALDRWAGRRQ